MTKSVTEPVSWLHPCTYVKDAMRWLDLNVTKCEDSNAGGLCGALEEFDNRILNLSAKP